jgi:hypothetical protein
VAQRQLPDFIEKLYHATVRHAEQKNSMKWGKKDPGFEYPTDVRLDEFAEDENMEDNVNKMKKLQNPLNDAEEDDEDEDSETESVPQSKPWWSYLLPYNYLH